MIIAALLLAAVTAAAPYESLLGPAQIAGKPATYAFYSEGDAGNGRRVVVYGYEAPEPESNFPHRVFVALLQSGKVVTKTDVTFFVANASQEGSFGSIETRVNLFTMGKRRFADVILWSQLAGRGFASSANDVIFNIDGDKLTTAAVLRDTAGYNRGVPSYASQTLSEITVRDDALIWTRSARSATGRIPDPELQVRCGSDRIVYFPKGNQLEASHAPLTAGKKSRTLPRLNLRELIPCCNRCTVKL